MNRGADQVSVPVCNQWSRRQQVILLQFMNLAFVSGQNFAANSFSCFIITSFQLKQKYLSIEALCQMLS